MYGIYCFQEGLIENSLDKAGLFMGDDIKTGRSTGSDSELHYLD